MLAPYDPEPDTSRADWVTGSCYGPLWTLHRIVPALFEEYLCFRHHGWRWPEDFQSEEFLALSPEEKGKRMVPARWSEVAEKFGQDGSKVTQWHSLVPAFDYENPQPGNLAPPLEGELPLVVLDEVFNVLLSYSGEDQECICAVWEGFGGHELKALVDAGAARIEGIGQQGHYLMHASLGTVMRQWRSVLVDMPESCGKVPQAVWPTTREWLFHVPFEMHASFLGGPADMTSSLLGCDRIDAYTAAGGVELL